MIFLEFGIQKAESSLTCSQRTGQFLSNRPIISAKPFLPVQPIRFVPPFFFLPSSQTHLSRKGHCHPKIISALINQAQRLTLSSRAFYNSVFGKFAQKVTTLFGYDMVLPMNTGAEAVETSLKLARKWAYKRKGVEEGRAIVLSVEGNFHGRTLGVIRHVIFHFLTFLNEFVIYIYV